MQKNAKILSVVILLGFGFFFAHSEMNFLQHDEVDLHEHHLHDYCQLVQGAKVERVQNVVVKYILAQPVTLLDDCANTRVVLKAETHKIKKKHLETPIYISNNILLI